MHLSANEIKEVVRTEELKKYYPLGTHTVKALDGVNLTEKRENLWQSPESPEAGKVRCCIC